MPGIKAIMPVHLYGQPADMQGVMDLAREKGLLVIEDSAQAHGAVHREGRCGPFGTEWPDRPVTSSSAGGRTQPW